MSLMTSSLTDDAPLGGGWSFLGGEFALASSSSWWSSLPPPAFSVGVTLSVVVVGIISILILVSQ